MAPAVSVVMPAYDAAATIGAAVTGVLWQQNVDLELLVVDDGSSDETAAIVDAMEKATRMVLEKTAERNDLRPEEREYVQRRLADTSPQSHALEAHEHLMEGRWSEAADAYGAAHRLSPATATCGCGGRPCGSPPRVAGPVLRRRG